MQDRENDQILEKLAALGSRLDALEVRVSALTHEETLKTEAKVRNADVFKETSPTPATPVAVAAPAISDSESPPPFRCPDWAGSNQEDSSNQAQAPQESTAGAGTKPGIWSDPDFFGRFCHYLKDHLSIGMCLGGVAVLCFIFASALLIKMAIDNGWLTPIRQVWITGIFGAAMCATGYKLRARDKRYFALLSGGGIVVMYIAVYGGAIYHHLYEWPISILLGSLISLYTLWLFAKLRSDFFAVAALVGTYLVPLLLPDFARLQTESGIFYILWDVVFIALAIRLCDWKLLMTAAYMATIGLILSRFCTQEQLPFITTQTIQAILFGCGVLCVCKHKPSLLTPSRSWGYIPLMMLTYLSMTIAGTSVYKGWLPEAVIFFTIWNILYMVMAFRLAQWKFLLTAAYFALIAFH